MATIYPWSQRAREPESSDFDTPYHASSKAHRQVGLGSSRTFTPRWLRGVVAPVIRSMAILAVAENTMSPLGENFKRGEETKPNDMDRALQIVPFSSPIPGTGPMVLTFQFGQGANSVVFARPS